MGGRGIDYLDQQRGSAPFLFNGRYDEEQEKVVYDRLRLGVDEAWAYDDETGDWVRVVLSTKQPRRVFTPPLPQPEDEVRG